jgi:hypothetical protein
MRILWKSCARKRTKIPGIATTRVTRTKQHNGACEIDVEGLWITRHPLVHKSISQSFFLNESLNRKFY